MPRLTQRLPKPKSDGAALAQLLEASKEAEKLISCFFDLNAIEGEPFQSIWDKLARAIEAAQEILKLQEPPAHTSKFSTH